MSLSGEEYMRAVQSLRALMMLLRVRNVAQCGSGATISPIEGQLPMVRKERALLGQVLGASDES